VVNYSSLIIYHDREGNPTPTYNLSKKPNRSHPCSLRVGVSPFVAAIVSGFAKRVSIPSASEHLSTWHCYLPTRGKAHGRAPAPTDNSSLLQPCVCLNLTDHSPMYCGFIIHELPSGKSFASTSQITRSSRGKEERATIANTSLCWLLRVR